MTRKSLIALLIWIACLIACLLLANWFFMRPDSNLKYERFFQEDEKTQPFDVFLMGTSHVFDGVYPMQLYRDYGIASYNIANSSELIEFTEWTLKLALQFHKPKMVVLDVYYVDRDLSNEWAYTYRHLFMDAMPLNLLKIESVTKTMASKYWDEFLVPFTLYHGRWEEMIAGTVELTMNSVPCMMGAELRLDRVPAYHFVRTTEMNLEEMPGKDAVRRIAALCKEQGIELVLTAIPCAAIEEEQKNMNSCAVLAEELGVPFINMFEIQDLVNFETDLYDGISHLNPDGAVKVTAYLGQWLDEHYDLPDRRQDKNYASWNDTLAEYEKYFKETWGPMSLINK